MYQGPGELRNLPVFAANYGPTALAIIDTFFYPEYSAKILELFQAAGMRENLLLNNQIDIVPAGPC